MLLIDLITSQQIDIITTTHCLHGTTVSAIAAVEKKLSAWCAFLKDEIEESMMMLSSEIEQKRAPESSNLTQGGPLFLPGIQILFLLFASKDLVCTTEDIFAVLSR